MMGREGKAISKEGRGERMEGAKGSKKKGKYGLRKWLSW